MRWGPLRKMISLKDWWHWCRTWRALPVPSWIRAEALLSESRYEEAADQYRKGLRFSPKHRARYYAALRLSHCLCKLGKFKEGIAVLERVIESAPRYRDAHVRLARLQLWLCRPRDAMGTIRRSFSSLAPDPELSALLLLAALESGDTGRGLAEARAFANHFANSNRLTPILAVALAKHDFMNGEKRKAKATVAEICSAATAPIEAFVILGEMLLREGDTIFGRKYLRRALSVSPQHPKVQTLLAESYLVEGPGHEPVFALQLASSACRNSFWEHPQAMHVLAEAFYQCGNKADALLVANKAREVGVRGNRRFRLTAADNEVIM